jgi:hypothetical protein
MENNYFNLSNFGLFLILYQNFSAASKQLCDLSIKSNLKNKRGDQ